LKKKEIRFGTGGWRGTLGDEVTAPRVRALVQGVAGWLADRASAARSTTSSDPTRSREIVLARDARLLGGELLTGAAAVLKRCGFDPLAVPGPVPTPVVVHAVTARAAAAGLVFTASHNPASDHGVKVIGPGGASLAKRDCQQIEALAQQALRAPFSTLAGFRPRAFDPVPAYLRRVSECLELTQRPARGLTVYYDALGGAGTRVALELLRRAGARVEALLAESIEPPQAPPDPSPARLRELARRIERGRGLRIGLATDGDADRFAAVDELGQCLNATEAFALLVDHLAAAGRIREGVGVSPALGSLVTRVAAVHGLRVERLPMGFSHAVRALREGRVELAGDESGGVAWSRVHCDKDGLLACALLAERVAARRVGLQDDRRTLRRFGSPHCDRRSVPATPDVRGHLQRWLDRPLQTVAGERVARTEVMGSGSTLRLAFPDGFLMLRASGTEAVVRIYAEARTARKLQRRLDAGSQLLGAGKRMDGLLRSR